MSEAIAVFPGVKEVNVYGVDVPGYDGRVGMAALVVDPENNFDLAGLYGHIAARLPTYARPMFLRFCRDLDVTGTFKQIKTNLVADGFSAARIADPIYFDDRARGVFRRIGPEFVDDLVAGTIKL